MEAIKIHVSNSSARVTQKPKHITAGMIGLPVEFDFDEEWNQLDKVAVFQAGGISRSVGVLDDQATVPPEVLAKPGVQLSIGVYGVDKDIPIGLPTIWANVGVIKPGANPVCPPSSDTGAALKIYQSAVNSANRAENAAKEAEASLKQIEEILDAGVDTGGISYFGWRYADAEAVYELNDEGSVKMYLFPNGDGYDAVVRYEGPDGQTGEITGYPFKYKDGKIEEDLSGRKYDAGKISRLHIEKGISKIGALFMYKAYNLKHLSFADIDGIKHLGDGCFGRTLVSGTYNFSGLEDTSYNGAFIECPNIEELALSSSIKTIGKRAFNRCYNLKRVTGLCNVTSIEIQGFAYCTSLEYLDVVPSKVTLDQQVFLRVPSAASAHNDAATVPLYSASWKDKSQIIKNDAQKVKLYSFVQNTWTDDAIKAIRGVTGNTVKLPVPTGIDWQSKDIYYEWTVFWQIYQSGGSVVCDPSTPWGHCQLFALMAVYNTMHPNAQYQTYYDFITKAIAPVKIEVTQDLYDALHQEGNIYTAALIEKQKVDGADFYALGNKISAVDLPLSLDGLDVYTVGDVGTAFWGICKALGWTCTEHIVCENREEVTASADDNKEILDGAAAKQKILDELAAGRPVTIEVYAHTTQDNGHAAHEYAVVGYDASTNKFRCTDSGTALPADVYPGTYWIDFEASVSSHPKTSIWTFDFGETITMTQIEENLKTLLQTVNSGFRVVKGTKYTISLNSAQIPILCFPVPEKPQLFVWNAKAETAQKILNKSNAETVTTNGYIVGGTVNFAHDFDELSVFKDQNPRGIVYAYKRLGAVGNIDYSQYGSESIASSSGGTYANEEVTATVGGITLGVTMSFPTSFEDGSKAEIEWTAYYWNE